MKHIMQGKNILLNIYKALGFMPVLLLALFLAILLFSYVSLGHIPHYGVDKDPVELGLFPLAWAGFVVLILNIVSIPLFIAVTMILSIARIGFVVRNHNTVIMFIISICLLLIIKKYLSPQIDWMMD